VVGIVIGAKFEFVGNIPESGRSLAGRPRNDTSTFGETPGSDCLRAFR
jgi:hypothetical protein